MSMSVALRGIHPSSHPGAYFRSLGPRPSESDEGGSHVRHRPFSNCLSILVVLSFEFEMTISRDLGTALHALHSRGAKTGKIVCMCNT